MSCHFHPLQPENIMTILHFPDQNIAGSKLVSIHGLVLPVAPQANHKIRFASMPKAFSPITPAEAIGWIGDLIKGGKEVKSVEIMGPGDILAAPQILLETLELLRNSFPEIEVGLTTLGLGAADLASDLAEHGVGQATVSVDAVDAEIAEKIYAWVRPGKKTIPLAQAATDLVNGQKMAVAALVQAGLKVRIQTTVYPGGNELHVGAIARKMAALGATSIVVRPFVAREEAEEKIGDSCDSTTLTAASEQAAAHLELNAHTVNPIIPPPMTNILEPGALLPKPTKVRPNVAVASSNGMDVDLHLGQASQILIYGPRDDGLACLLEARETPEAGSGTSRWQTLAEECLYDCFALLAANAGENPKKVLADRGIKIIVSEDNIEGTVDVLYGGGKKQKCKK